MICPQCAAEGSLSKILTSGGGIRTGMLLSMFYDELGRYHAHDPNRTVSSAICSNGHRLTLLRSNSCQVEGCDFGYKATIELDYAMRK